MKSSACRHGECDLCSPLGRVRLANTKTIGCDCNCHLALKKKIEAFRLREIAREQKELNEDE